MKHLLVVILLLMAGLVATVTGCRGTRVPDDARLVAADSLLASAPDSTLALVEALALDSLSTDGDRAYRDLLLTQARYKCYITATSDSDINRALGYYRAHSGEQEKLTRAYIYKGAVMEELGHPDSAMLYYKHAEATAAPDDYFNLGYTNLRIADLYRKNFGDKEICFKKYQSALKYYELIGDKWKQQNCLYNMGMCAGITHNADPVTLLNQALGLAIELNDSALQFDCLEMLCRQYAINDTSRLKAKRLAFDCLYGFRQFINNDLILDISIIYAYENRLDSAYYYIQLVDETLNSDHIEQIKYRKYEVLSLLSKSEVFQENLSSYRDSAKIMSDIIRGDVSKYSIQRIENKFQDEQESKRTGKINSLKAITWTLIAFVIVMCTTMSIVIAVRIKRVNRIIQGYHNQGIQLQDDFTSIMNSKNELLAQFTESITMLIHLAIKAQSIKDKIDLDKKIRNTIDKVANNDFWKELIILLDKDHYNIISKIVQDSHIKEKDIRFIVLSCLGFSYLEIAVILGYSPNYISRKRKDLAQKLHIDIPLQDYLNNLMCKQNA